MNAPLTAWADKQMREVTEGVRPCRRISLTSDGITWEKWEPVIGVDPAEWTKGVEEYLNAICDELPARKVQLTFTAEDETGATLATFLRTVTGRNKAAADLGTQAGAKALADGVASIVKTVDAALATARNMMEFMAEQLKTREQDLVTRNDELRKAHELIAMIQKIETEEGAGTNPVATALVQHVNEAAPVALQALQYWLEKRHTEMAALGKIKSAAQPPNAAAAAPANGKTS